MEKSMNKIMDSILSSAPVNGESLSSGWELSSHRKRSLMIWKMVYSRKLPRTVKGARVCNLFVLTLPSPVRWSGVLIKMAHGFMAGHKDLELVKKKGHKFCTILCTLYSEVSSHSYKGTRIRHSKACHFGVGIILGQRQLSISRHRKHVTQTA